MAHMLVDQHVPSQIAHYLTHLNQNAPGLLQVKSYRLYVWVNFAPLLGPVGTDSLMAFDKTTLKRSGPCHVPSHVG